MPPPSVLRSEPMAQPLEASSVGSGSPNEAGTGVVGGVVVGDGGGAGAAGSPPGGSAEPMNWLSAVLEAFRDTDRM